MSYNKLIIIYIYIYIHTDIHTYIHTYIHIIQIELYWNPNTNQINKNEQTVLMNINEYYCFDLLQLLLNKKSYYLYILTQKLLISGYFCLISNWLNKY